MAAVPSTPAQVYESMATLVAQYDFLRLETLGQSALGYPLQAVSLGSGPAVFVSAAHHANEWITAPLLLRYLADYARAVDTGGSIAGADANALFAAVTLTLMPLVNPGGMALVTGTLESRGFYDAAAALAANYPDIPFPLGWKANLFGTDPNLNYPAGWEEAKRIKFAQGYTLPGPRDYVGTSPLCAAESRALYDFTRARDFALILAYHTQGEVIYWRYLDYDPPGARAIAQRLAAASGYALEETPYASGFAGYKDWFIETYNRPGFTIEAGAGQNPLPLSELESMYAANAPLITAALQAVGQGI